LDARGNPYNPPDSNQAESALAEAGTTFTDFVLGERLDRVHRMLVNPVYRNRGISAIAYDAGFGDVSYFNRTFRRRYGATPSDVREAAQGPTSPRRGDVK
jgi:AraC-like DNA-binding protein